MCKWRYNCCICRKDTLCASGGTTAAFVGATKTNIGKNCADGGQTTTLNLNGTTINQTGNTININAPTLNIDTTDFDIDSTNVCISAVTKANFYGATTNIGIDCGGTTAATVNVSGATINNGGTTNNNNFTTVNNTATTINNKATNYNISGATTVRGNTNISGTSLTVSAATNITGATNIKGATTISGSSLSVTGATNLNGNVCVTGTVTASQAIYSSDRDLKENIDYLHYDLIRKIADVRERSFNFKGEENRVYGVIAQEVQEAGFDELVYTKDDGHLAVDYTSLMILKIAYLENLCQELLYDVDKLKEEINSLKLNNQK